MAWSSPIATHESPNLPKSLFNVRGFGTEYLQVNGAIQNIFKR